MASGLRDFGLRKPPITASAMATQYSCAEAPDVYFCAPLHPILQDALLIQVLQKNHTLVTDIEIDQGGQWNSYRFKATS